MLPLPDIQNPVEAGGQPIQLEITGPPEATAMVADLFGR
jgi:hypothetical protein